MRVAFPGRLPAAPLLGFLVAFVLAPVALLLGTGLAGAGGAAAIEHAVLDPVNVRAIQNSVVEGGVSALAAFGVGYPIGLFLGRTSFRGRSWLLGIALVPFLLPTVAVVLGVQEAFGADGLLRPIAPALGVLSYGFGGIVLTNVVFNAPLLALLTSVGVESASSELEESVAALGGSPFRAFRSVWAGPSLHGALSGALLTFLFSSLAFAGPILIGGARWYTLEARIYVLAQTLAEPRAAAALAAVALLLLAAPTALYLLASRRLATGPARRAAPPRPFDPSSAVDWGLGAFAVIGVLALLSFLALVVERGFAPASPGTAWGGRLPALFAPALTDRLGFSTGAALLNTLAFAGLSSALAFLLALGASHRSARPSRPSRSLAALTFLPLLVSPVVLAFALSNAWRPLFGGVSAAADLIVIGQAALALPFVLQSLGLAFEAVPRAAAESAEALGASPWQSYLEAELPLALPGARAALLFAFALGLGEFTATNFLATPSTTTLSVELYRLGSLRLGGFAPTIAALLVLLSLATLGPIAYLGGGRARVL
ncbi:MAG TPA: ABC transporter permease subunit [Thermoplasmata archaeon]|nr:ABC transporter permease subunit [Thermoplasmata archaeon]